MAKSTIAASNQLKERLDELKKGSKESYEDVIHRLIDECTTSGEIATIEEARQVANEQISERVVPEAQQ